MGFQVWADPPRRPHSLGGSRPSFGTPYKDFQGALDCEAFCNDPSSWVLTTHELCTKNSKGSMLSLWTSDTAGNKPSPCRKEFATALRARNREIAIDLKCLTLPILQRTSLGGALLITTERKLDNPVNNIHASTWPASPPVRWQIFASLVI